MREILFRGKRKEDGKWITGFLVSSKHIGDWVTAYPVVPETVGQFTGLTDKNGTKVFEGDIFLIRGMEPSVNGLYTVEFSEANHCWWLKNPNPLDHSFSFSDLNGFHEDGEVVGTIHDNPEIMEVSE